MRTWIKQEPKKKNCGVIAVAVIAGVTVEEAAKAIGKNGATSTKKLAKGLRALGYKCPDRCVRTKPPLGLGQLHDTRRKSGWHWVVVDGNLIFDGIYGNPNGTVNWVAGQRLTSYLPVTQ